MDSALLLEGGEPTYNECVDVVRESATLATASQQHWKIRQAIAADDISRIQARTDSSVAERDWKDYCKANTGFLQHLLWRGVHQIEKPLRVHWNGNKTLSKEASRLWGRDAAIELLIPFSHVPLRFVIVKPRIAEFQIRPSDSPDFARAFLLGRPYVSVSWKGEGFFVITPEGGFVEMQTYFIDHPTLGHWSTDHVLPSTFSRVAKEFERELSEVATHFEPLLQLLTDREQLGILNTSIEKMGELEQLWAHIYLPESQKTEVLKALELFENDVPGSPRGLLLTGPSGVGKSLLGKTIAETVGCSFQHLTPAALKMDHLGGSGQRVREVWAKARQEQPSILYLDECEGVLGRRGSAETDAISTEIVQAFLAEWDGLSKDDRVLVIGATNRRDLLDDAILSRFGWEMKIPLPSEEDRIRILEQELKSVDIDANLPAEFGPLTQGMSGRDLQEAARTSRRMAHPEMPSLEQIREAVAKLRKGRNTVVSADSRWENLVLDAKLLSRLKLVSGLLRDTEKWRAQGISIPRSLLLQGPSGTGKTEIGRTLANESGLAFFAATTADLKANYLGQSGNRVKQVFERARAHAPSILFLDGLDIVAPNRGVGEDDPLTREIVGQLLQEIDGVQAHPEHVFLLGATNRPEAVDGAILSRFAERPQVPLPDHAARIQLLSILLKGKKFNFSSEDGVRLLADLTENKAFSGRDLRSWVAAAEQSALMRAFESGGPDKYVITLDDFSSTI